MAQNWIKDAIQKPGALRESLGIKKGKDIPASKLEKAKESKSPITRKRAVLTETLAKLAKKRKK